MADLGSQLMSARSSRKSPMRQSIALRRSNLSLRQSSATDELGNDNTVDNSMANTSRFSLAHELAAALMPDPNSSSRSLADEFGIEFDESEEGIEEQDEQQELDPHVSQLSTDPRADYSFGAEEDQLGGRRTPTHKHADPLNSADDHFISPNSRRNAPPPPPQQTFEQDPLVVLSQTLKSTDLFLNQLKRVDAESLSASTSSHHEPPLERVAGDILRHLNETTRTREEQVRELTEYEREFRKMAGELGGNDILGDLDALEYVEGLLDERELARDGVEDDATIGPTSRPASGVWEDEIEESNHLDYGLDPLQEVLQEDELYGEPSPSKDAEFLPPPPSRENPLTPTSTIPHLAHMRTISQSLVNSLGTISDQAQVNGAATADAGRKLRALKHRIEEWRSEWESAEKSRIRVERWETAGIWEDVSLDPTPSLTPSSSSRGESPSPGTPPAPVKRLDVKKIVEEEIKAFELVLIEAGNKTKAIMASTQQQ